MREALQSFNQFLAMLPEPQQFGIRTAIYVLSSHNNSLSGRRSVVH
jgi:hypothetical protein